EHPTGRLKRDVFRHASPSGDRVQLVCVNPLFEGAFPLFINDQLIRLKSGNLTNDALGEPPAPPLDDGSASLVKSLWALYKTQVELWRRHINPMARPRQQIEDTTGRAGEDDTAFKILRHDRSLYDARISARAASIAGNLKR